MLSYCVMYGQCNYNSTRDSIQNCYQKEGTMEAINLNTTHDNYEEAVNLLKTNCPSYFYNDDGSEIGKNLIN